MIARTLKLYRDSYAGHPRQIWTLAIITFINRMGTMVMPFLTLYLTTVLNFSLKDAGLLAGCFGLGSLSGSFLGGRLTDRIGPNTVITCSLFFGGLAFICVQWASTITELACIIYLAAALGESYRPAMMVSIRRFVPKSETGRSIALIRLAINIGFSAAPALGGLVAITLGYKYLFWIDGITCVLAAGYFFHRSRRWPVYQPKDDLSNPAESAKIAVPPYRNLHFMLLLFTIALMGFGIIQWFQSIPVFMKTEWFLDERFFGLAMALNGLLIVVFEVPMIHRIEHGGKIRWAIYTGIILTGLSFLPLLLPAAFLWCIVSIVLFSFGEMLYMPLVNSIALNMSPDKRSGEYMAWFSMTWSTMHILGPVVGLPLIAHIGFSAFWVFMCLACLMSLVFTMRLLPKFKD